MRSAKVAMLFAAWFILAGGDAALAQLTAASEGPVAYGHHHLNVTDRAAHERFWGDTLGGIPTPWRDVNIFKFPNVLVFLTEREPTGGTIGTTVNHVGFWVPSVQAALNKVRAAGYPVVTRQELPTSIDVEDGIAHIANQDTNIAYVMAPDNIKVEFVENRSQGEPIAMHHLHFYTDQVDAMKTWYVETFDAEPGMRGSFQAADLPGVNLTFSAVDQAPAGTQGRSFDHVGFEVDDLEAFCQKLEAQGITFDRPYTEIEALNIAIAFFTDPFGTYIELTEGLDNY
jgi:catechol 2,3-dioxygenase-like lactoylglutathione lyase family enzyme